MPAPLELIISVYSNPDLARQTLDDLRGSAASSGLDVTNAAVLVKDANGRMRVDETEDVKPGRGALFGAITGGLIGLLAGPAGVVAGALAGAAAGGVTAAVVDMGFSDDQLAELRASLPANSSALVVLIEHAWVEKLVNELESRQGKLFRHELAPDFNDRFSE